MSFMITLAGFVDAGLRDSHSLTRSARRFWWAMGCCAALMSACTPALNWREVRFDQGRLVGWLPCKPDRAQRAVDLGGQAGELSMLGCAADDLDFTLGQLTLPAGLSAEQALQAWKVASLASLQANPATPTESWALAGAAPVPAPTRMLAQGRQGVTAQWAWFAYDGHLYQAGVYTRSARSTRPAQEAMQVFLSGFKLP